MSAGRGRATTVVAAVLGVGFALAAPVAAQPGDDDAGRRPAARVVDKDSARLQKEVRTGAIMRHLRELQVVADRYGDRAAGHEGYNASSRYVEATLRKAGYRPQRQYFDFTYTRVNTHTLTVAGEEVANDVLTGSPSTDGPVTAELVTPTDPLGCTPAAWEGVDVTGRIALVQRGSCPFADKSTAAGAAGAAALVIRNNVEGPLNSGTLGETTPDMVPTTGISQADGQALVDALAQGPVEATLDLDITVEQRRTWNVIAETGTGRSDNVVMLGAHLDGVQDGPGINDNGSGSATLLETAVQLADKPFPRKLRNQVRFAWWGAEEVGLLGSEHYVEQLVAEDPGALDDIAVYLNFDMLGSPNYRIGVFDADESTYEASAPVPAGSIEMERAWHAYFDAIGQPAVDTPFSGRSDYQAFIVNGVAAGGLFSGGDDRKTPAEVELFGGEAGEQYDPSYHTPADDLGNVNRRSLTIMSDAIAHMVVTLGKDTDSIDTPSGAPRPVRRAPSRLPEGVVRR